ncbi:MAG: PKD domain-containing protein [Ginsengibacter sp.]
MILLLATIFCQSQLHADFIATPDAGCAPLVVNFDDFSSGHPSSWKWDLGNGTTSFLQNPSATYFIPGEYNITLIVKNAQGEDFIVKSGFIKVYASPQVNFSGTPQSGCFPLPAQFTDLTDAGSGTTAQWEWDFGDGELSTGQNPKHTYLAAGNYNISLRASNNFGCVNSATKPGYITISSGINAGFTNTLPASCNQSATIQFTDTSSGVGVLSYQWQFGDGATSVLKDPSHAYNVGSYTVSLIVFNSNGCSDTITKPNLITLGNVKADFSAPAIICQGSNVDFLNTSSPTPSAASWNFGDGTTSGVISPVKAFANPGYYSIKMIGTFGACKDSVTRPVKVAAKSVIDFTATPVVSCSVPITVNFSDSSIGANAVSWDFGDGTSSDLPNPSHTYVKEGFYSVNLAVTNDAGCTNSLVKKDFIKIKSPVVSINNLPQKGCAPLTHTFTAAVTSIDPVIKYLWDFGDGTTSVLSSPTHIYTIPGVYDVTLFYSTSSGCTDSVKVIRGILVGSRPGMNFSANPRDVCAETKVNFTDLSTGNPDEWLWLFGDGSVSVAKNPEHLYNDSGYFAVTLIAINNGCADTLVVPKYIHVKPPIAKFTYTTTCGQAGHVVFTDASIGADTWKWDFDDGSYSTAQNPVHDYTVSGVYTVQLTVTNNTTGCAYTKIDVVNVLKEIADFTSNVTAVCKNTPVIFNTLNSIPANIGSYTWRFGDGTTVTGTSNSISHSYKGSGSFNVTLVLNIKNGCKDSIVKPLAIQVDGPSAVFRTVNPGACENTAVTFIDSSYPNSTHAIVQWQWNWGDGLTQNINGPVVQHTYTAPGSYSVSLKVTDHNGCTDSIRHLNTVVISKPVATFKGDTLSCTSHPVALTNLSTGPKLTYLWNFGDGATSSQLNPVHTYNTEGSYTVSLSINDQYGCSDFISKTNYVRIADARADFSVSDTVGNCPPLVVNFTNTATNYSSIIWNFGDGSTSSSFSPSHFYATPGTFHAVLTVKGPGGCTDQKSVQIRVKGPTGSFAYTNISGCKPLQTNFKATTAPHTSFVWDFSDGTTLVTPDSIVSHSFKTAGAYLPKMILVDAQGCKVPVTGKDSIKVFEVFASFTNPIATLCDSGRIAFTNTSSGNDIVTDFLWDFGDKTTSVLPNPEHNYADTGLYVAKLFVTSKNGCTDSVTMLSPVKIVNSPKISIGGSPGACTPALLTFTGIISVPDTSSLRWKWDFANGNVSTLQNPPAQIFLNTGTYSVHAVATNSSGCNDTVIKVVEAYPIPDLQPTNDTTLCKGKSLVLQARDAQTYSWSPALYLSCANCAGPVARPDTTIQYFVTGKSDKGCLSRDSVFIDVKFPNTVHVSGLDTLCRGSFVQLVASGAEVYSWSPSIGLNNTSIASPIASPGSTTIYKVTGSDTKGCFTSKASIPIKVFPVPVVTVGVDKTINVGQFLTITPEISTDVTNISWTPSTGIIARDYPGITVKPQQSIEYTIEVSNAGGCKALDRISVYVTCDNTNVFMPNTFSPNGDGINDIFYPRGSGVFAVKNLRIFNRWGEVIFERANFNANDASRGWDGTYKGNKLSPDSFVFMLEVVCSNNQSLVFKGNVALIR